MSTSVPVTLKKSFMAVAWSVYPTGAWLAEHGWATEGRCPTCGGADDIVHAFAGCHAEAQDGSIEECLKNWERAAGRPMGKLGPTDANDREGV